MKQTNYTIPRRRTCVRCGEPMSPRTVPSREMCDECVLVLRKTVERIVNNG